MPKGAKKHAKHGVVPPTPPGVDGGAAIPASRTRDTDAHFFLPSAQIAMGVGTDDRAASSIVKGDEVQLEDGTLARVVCVVGFVGTGVANAVAVRARAFYRAHDCLRVLTRWNCLSGRPRGARTCGARARV